MVKFVFFLTAFVLVACSKYKSIFFDQNQSSTGLIESSSLCTTGANYEAVSTSGNADVQIYCLDENNNWVAASRKVEAQSGVRYGEPSLALSSKGTVMALYHRDSAKDGFQIAVSRTRDNGWMSLGSLVNFDNGKLHEAYTQFGASLTEYQGAPFVFWTGYHNDAFLSRYNGTTWTHAPIQEDPSGNPIRHPEILNTGDDLYVYYGSPQPTVWHWAGSHLDKVGAIQPASSETTLYSSLTIWQGNPVIAYSSDDAKNGWAINHSKVKVAELSKGVWSTLGEVQDLAGHDGVNPFVFTLGEDLYVMYGDYATEGLPLDPNEGLPLDPNKVRFRFRVKKWNGVSFQRVGDESPAVMLSQRFEFTKVEDRIYFGAVLAPENGQYSQVVLSWKDGQFSQVGSPIVTTSNGFWRARPGRVIVTEGLSLSSLGIGKLMTPPFIKPKPKAGEVVDPNTIAVTPRFVDTSSFNFRLQSSSPTIDAGMNCGDVVTSDADGNNRPNGFRCDIGAYEYLGFE